MKANILIIYSTFCLGTALILLMAGCSHQGVSASSTAPPITSIGQVANPPSQVDQADADFKGHRWAVAIAE